MWPGAYSNKSQVHPGQTMSEEARRRAAAHAKRAAARAASRSGPGGTKPPRPRPGSVGNSYGRVGGG